MTDVALKLPEHLLEQARAAAAEEDVPVDQLLAALIAEGMEQRQDLKSLKERASRADIEAALAILDRAPDVPPDAGDEVLDDDGMPAPGTSLD